MKNRLRLLFVLMLFVAASAQAQTAPPYITEITPAGAKRGATVNFTIDGYNLGGASEILWSRPGITSKIVLNSELVREPRRRPTNPADQVILDRATKNQLTIEATIAADAAPGFYGYRIVTPLGTTNLGRIIVGILPETRERETMEPAQSDAAMTVQKLSLPATVVGELQRRGDSDSFKFAAKSGQQIVFEVVASALGSKLDSVLTLFDETGRQLAANNDFDGRKDSLLGYTFQQDGEYTLRIHDFERQGQRGQYGYRLNIGELRYLTHAFPLGARDGVATEVAIHGFNLDSNKITITSRKQAGFETGVPLLVKSARGESFNSLKMPVGVHPEVMESGTRSTLASPQPVTLPVTINGRIFSDAGASDEDFYRFKARKGQRLAIEVGARRYGSPLDSVIEVLDAK
ncbi:MAG: PPC domain-containing protein, partial [Blastocatellia bacterium]